MLVCGPDGFIPELLDRNGALSGGVLRRLGRRKVFWRRYLAVPFDGGMGEERGGDGEGRVHEGVRAGAEGGPGAVLLLVRWQALVRLLHGWVVQGNIGIVGPVEAVWGLNLHGDGQAACRYVV